MSSHQIDWEQMYRTRVATCEFVNNDGNRCHWDKLIEDRPGFVEKTHTLCRHHHGELICQNVVIGYRHGRHMQCGKRSVLGRQYCASCQCRLYGCDQTVYVRRSVNGDCDGQDVYCETHRDQMEWADPLETGDVCTDKWCDVIFDAVRERVANLKSRYDNGEAVCLPFGFGALEWDDGQNGVFWLGQEVACFNRWYQRLYPNSRVLLEHAADLKDCRVWLVNTVPKKYLFWLSLFSRNGGFCNRHYLADASSCRLSPSQVESHFGQLTAQLATELTESDV